MNRGLVTFACVVLATLAWSGSSRAQDAKGFGSKGQLIISADRLFPLFSYTSSSETEHPNNNETRTTSNHGSSFVLLLGNEPQAPTVINPHTLPRAAVDFTVIDRLTVGGDLVIGFGLGGSHKVEDDQGGTTRSTSTDAPTVTIIGIGPRVGYVLPLNDWLAFWPRGGISFYSIRVKSVETPNNPNQPETTTTNSATVFSIDLDPQLVIVPTQHFFFTGGLLMNIPLGGSLKSETSTGGTTTSVSNDFSIFHFGLEVGLGGWLDL